jgi:hypothetical protein
MAKMDGNVNTLTREQLDVIGQGIADLSLRIDVAKHEMLTQLRTFDAHDGWANSGFLSLPAWLAWRIDIGPVAAREYVRVARALGELKLVDAAFAAGKLSYSKVRAITRSATPETEQGFLDISSNATASQIERLSAAYRRIGVDPMARAIGSTAIRSSQRYGERDGAHRGSAAARAGRDRLGSVVGGDRCGSQSG